MDRDTVVAIVDDTLENVKVLRQLLHRAGYRTLCHTNPIAALKAFQKRPPDLILLDVNMPEMDGHTCCQQLKADEALSEIPVIFISALSASTDVLKGFQVGGADYIVKPFRMEEVLARVNAHVGNALLRKSLRESYRKVLELEAARDDLVHMLVHDIRSPLSAVRGYAELCERHFNKGLVPSERSFAQIQSGVNRISRMLDEILTVSKIEKTGLEVMLGRFDLVQAILSIVNNLQVSDSSRTIETDLPESRVCIVADRSLTIRIIENLLGNAVKFTPRAGVVKVSLKLSDPQRVELSISDQGPGIEEDDKSRIFDKYQQAGSGASRYNGSVGLGLSFCRLAVEAQNGRIGVRDGAAGGSCFWLSLPRKIKTV